LEDNRFALRFGLPSKGELEAPTLSFLAQCGLTVDRTNPRQYIALIPSVPQVQVLFQRPIDVLRKVEDGSLDLGVTGYDIVREESPGSESVAVLIEDLGFGRCSLVVAVPESWLDVSSMADLADLALLYRSKGKHLRIATKYPTAARTFLYERTLTNFVLVQAQGALEAVPSLGDADLIIDITSTGTTLKENRLKLIDGGTVFRSQACLVGNRRTLGNDESRLEACRAIVELVEAHARSKKYVTLSASIKTNAPETMTRQLTNHQELMGLHGPSLAKVYPKNRDADWYAITMTIEARFLLEAVDHLRKAGGTDIVVTPIEYIFDSRSWNFERLVKLLRGGTSG
jgi:ATP phosphoribosyltransferase